MHRNKGVVAAAEPYRSPRCGGRRSDGRRGAAMNDTARDDFKTALHDLIATARENGLSDEALIGELADAAAALREALS